MNRDLDRGTPKIFARIRIGVNDTEEGISLTVDDFKKHSVVKDHEKIDQIKVEAAIDLYADNCLMSRSIYPILFFPHHKSGKNG
jgi:hypothetical protein